MPKDGHDQGLHRGLSRWISGSRETLQHARDRFRAAGFEVSGGVTTTDIGKRTNSGWKEIPCYTDMPTQERLQQIFEYAAGFSTR